MYSVVIVAASDC